MTMIQVHITELFAVPVWQQSLMGQISLFLGGPAAAPLFMMIMGYLAGSSNRGSGYFFRRGAKLVLWGLMLNLGMNVHLLLRIWLEGWPQNPWHYVFGVDILFLAGLSLMSIAIVDAAGRYWWLIALVMMAGIIWGLNLEPDAGDNETIATYLMSFVHSDASWSYFPLIPWAIYPLAGFAFARLQLKQTRFLTGERDAWILLIAGSLISALFFDTGWDAATNLTKWYHHGPEVVLWNMVFVATLSVAAMLFVKAYEGSRTVSFLSWSGRNVTAFYVIQWLMIGNMATLIYQTQYLLQLLMWFVVVSMTSAVLVWLWNWTKQQFLHLQLPKS